MKEIIRPVVISMTLIVSVGAAYAQDTPTPKPENAERDAFQTLTAGKKDAPASSENNKVHSDANPESRLNDDPPPNERLGVPNTGLPK